MIDNKLMIPTAHHKNNIKDHKNMRTVKDYFTSKKNK